MDSFKAELTKSLLLIFLDRANVEKLLVRTFGCRWIFNLNV